MTIDLLMPIVVAIYLYPGFVLYLLFHSIVDIKPRKRNLFILMYFNIFVLSTLYWLLLAIIVLRVNLSAPSIITIVSLGLPTLLLLLKMYRFISAIFKKLRKNLKERKLGTVKEKIKKICGSKRLYCFLKNNLLVSIQVLLLSGIFFLSSYHFELIDPTLPAGHDRNTHLAIILWFLEENSMMVRYPGTLFLNYRPVGFHMLLAIIFKIILFLFGLTYSSVSHVYLTNMSTISSLFCAMVHFFISFYPIAVFSVVYELSNESESLALLSSLAAISYIGYIVALEPLHHLLGLYVVGFFIIMVKKLKDGSQLMKSRSWILLAFSAACIILIHPYAFIYLVLVLLFLVIEAILSKIQEGLKIDKIIRVVGYFVFIILLSGAFALMMYPEFIVGLALTYIRANFNNGSYWERLEDYATSPIPKMESSFWETICLYIKTNLYGYLYYIATISLLIAICGIFLYIYG